MKRILVCLDTSPRAPHVLDAGLDLARRTGAKVRLFRAVGLPHDVPASLYTNIRPNELAGVLLEQAKKDLTALGRDVSPELLDGIDAHVGSPWDGICRAARDYDADLIVIGSHGYSAVDRLLGTTAAKVVNHADRTVLVVRPKPGG
jgi:nucleotide-binding universal stress UspA family protein